MRIDPRVVLPVCVVVLAAGGVIGAPAASAGCNDSSGTVVCAQGDIRGTNAPPPVKPELGSYGAWCNGNVCFPGNLLGVMNGP